MLARLLAAIAMAGAMTCSPTALSHDDPKPRRGGIVQLVNDIAYELVAMESGVEIYIADHGKPVSTLGMSGKLTVMVGTQQSEAPLVATGDKLEARGVRLARGAKAVAALIQPDKKVVMVRFALK